MEENQGGTPNPLNPNRQTTGLNVIEAFLAKKESSSNSAHPVDSSTPTEIEEPKQEEKTVQIKVERPKPPVRLVNTAGSFDMVRPASAARPVSVTQPEDIAKPNKPKPIPVQPQERTDDLMETLGVVTDMGGSAVSAETFDPAASRPMEKAPASVVVKPKKKKLGLIIGMIACLFVAIACGIVAVLLLNNQKSEDPVALAVDKLLSENAEKNAKIDGTINIQINDPTSKFSNFNISLDSQMIIKTMMNATTATLDANLKNGESFTTKFNELYASGDELYLKIEGAPNLAELLNSSTEEKATLETVNNMWLKVSFDDLKILRPDYVKNNNLECGMSWVDGVNRNINSMKRLYANNPFVTSTEENIAVPSVNYPVHKFLIDEDNFNIFLNGAYEIDLLSDSNGCPKNRQSDSFSIDDVIETVKQLPDVYLEVDENNNFTRIYSIFDIDSSKITIKIDLNISYPKVINISDPIEFKVLSDILQGKDATEAEKTTEK